MTKQSQISITQVSIAEDAIDHVAEVMRSGNVRAGAICHEFEEVFAAHEGAAYGVAVNSGTAALHLAYLCALEPNSEVLVPSLTFFATASMVVAAGATPVFCDIDPNTLTIDLADAARRITPRTRAIAPVHIYGNVCDLDAINRFADEHDLKIIWDAAQAHGATWRNQPIGSTGFAVCYSFYPSKNMTTGEGGIVLTNDGALRRRLEILRDQGQSEKYQHVEIGYNYRMTDIQAAIGLSQMRTIDSWTMARRSNAARLREQIERLPGLTVQGVLPSANPVYHQFAILVEDRTVEGGRDRLRSALAEEGIESGIHYPIPLHLQPVFSSRYGAPKLPVSERVCASVLTLPVHSFLTDHDVNRIAEAVVRCVTHLTVKAA